MTSGTAWYYPPVAQFADRLLVAWPPLEPFVWDEIHKEVQEILSALDAAVRSKVPQVQVKLGKAHSRSFDLFSYRTFTRGDEEGIDPVVVGLAFVTIWNEDEKRIAMEADVSGERGGDEVVASERRIIAPVREELLRAARAVATELSRHADRIAGALEDRSRIAG